MAKLTQVLSEANVTTSEPAHGKAFFEFLKAANIASPDDFVGFVSEASYDADWKEFCSFTDDKQDKDGTLDRILWARVKKAWETLVAIKKDRKGDQASLNDDKLEDPLPQLTANTLADLWEKRYHLELDPHMRPADALVARIYREMKRNTASLIDIAKVRSLIHASAPEVSRQVAIDGQRSLNFTEDGGTRRRMASTTAYYFGMRTLGYAYAYAGNEMVASKEDPSIQVINCPLNVNIDYADRALRLTSGLACHESASLIWLRARDAETRATMIGLMRMGWPQGEALIKAQKEHALEWASGTKKKSDADSSAELLGGEHVSSQPARHRGQKRKFPDTKGSGWQPRRQLFEPAGNQYGRGRGQGKGKAEGKGHKGKGKGKY